MENTKIVERIRKLLAMAEDTSSPNEAAIAASRAAKLLAEHNLSRASVLLDTLDQDGLTESKATTSYKRQPRWVAFLLVVVADLHDCSVRYAYVGRGESTAEFLGEKDDAEVASYVFDYLVSEINRLTEAYKKANPGIQRKRINDYRLGASLGINKTLRAIINTRKAEAAAMPTAGTALVVVKQQLIEQKYGKQRSSKCSVSARSSSFSDGKRDGSRIRVNSAVGHQSKAAIR